MKLEKVIAQDLNDYEKLLALISRKPYSAEMKTKFDEARQLQHRIEMELEELQIKYEGSKQLLYTQKYIQELSFFTGSNPDMELLRDFKQRFSSSLLHHEEQLINFTNHMRN